MPVDKPRILIIGKLPPPYFGPAIATKIILSSRLNEHYAISHFDSSLNTHVEGIGKWGLRKTVAGLGQYLTLARTLRRVRPDLVLIPVSQSTMGFVKDSVFIHLSRAFGARVLLHLRGSNFLNWFEGASALTRTYVRLTLRRARGVIVLGRQLRSIFEPFFDASSIHVVPNGADFDIPLPPDNKEDKTGIIFLSNFLLSKGITDVIEAMIMIDSDLSGRFSFRAMGSWYEPELRRRVEGRIAEHALDVEFIPPAESANKMHYLAKADIFIFPPRLPEGHPWVIVEALAAGLPVIATDQGAITESVEDGVNGFIVGTGDTAAMAVRLGQLIRDPAMRTRMGQESRRIYEERFTESAMVENLRRAIEAARTGGNRHMASDPGSATGM